MKRRLAFLAEDRLCRGPDGRIRALDPSFAGGGWGRGLEVTEGAFLAARTASHDIGNEHPVAGDVVALPYYEGLGGLLRKAPLLIIAIFRCVRSAETVAVRLPGMIGLLGILAAVVLRRPVAVEVVGDIGDVLDSGVGGRIGRVSSPLVTALVRWGVGRASWVRYVTRVTLQERYPAAVRARTFAFSDVELDHDNLASDRAVEPHGEPTVVAVGSHEQTYKGHDLLIRSVAKLKSEGLRVQLRLLGAGRFQADLKRLARDLDVTDQVSFLGHVSPHAAVLAEVRAAWVFAMPSRTEGMPRALIEAMAVGVTCVGSRVGGIPELLPEECTFDSDDQRAIDRVLLHLLTHAGERRRLGEQNRELAASLWRSWTFERGDWVQLLDDRRKGAGHVR